VYQDICFTHDEAAVPAGMTRLDAARDFSEGESGEELQKQND